jgi:ribosome-associated protein
MEDEPGFLRVSGSLRIPLSELVWRFSRSGGPGGQHANTSDTRVDLRFDIESSPSLGPRQQARLLERLGPTVRVTAADERSQLRNREIALQRLTERLTDALRVETPRRPSRPTKAAKQRRLDTKKRQSTRKAERRRPTRDD